jgi:signal transduction histidine kinase
MHTVNPMTDTQPLRGFRAGAVLDFTVRSWFLGWPAIGQLTVDCVLAIPYLLLVMLTLLSALLVPVLLIGLPFLVIGLAIGSALGHFERIRIQAMTGVRIAPPARPAERASLPARLLRDPRRWWALLYLTAISLWGLIAGSVVIVLISTALATAAVPLYAPALPGGKVAMPWDATVGGVWWLLLIFAIGVLGLLITPLLAQALVQVDILAARWLLGPGRDQTEQVRQLSQRVQTLTQTREATVDSVETERRRIERDLHDGPQQRLVAIAMDLGMAQERLNRDPAGARELLDKAHSAAKEAITEMRQVARGIHPPVLTDRGLDAALSALAARSPVPVRVSVDLPVRPSPTIEAIAYFCVSEALTNVAKHAQAQSAQVSVGASDGLIRIEVRDDGVGGAAAGATPADGTGLTGLADRVAAIDGTLAVDSPPGGPTLLTIVLPATGNRS